MNRTIKYLLISLCSVIILLFASFVVLNILSQPMHSMVQNYSFRSMSDGEISSFGLGVVKSAGSVAPRSKNESYLLEDTADIDQDDAGVTNKKIIKNGSLDLYVKNIDETAENIKTLTVSLSGFVEDAQVSQSKSGNKSGYVRIRIPADKFEDTINNLKQLAVEVDNESVNSQDVTEEFVDFEAQLRSLKAQEEQYLEIMKKATSVEEILKVSNQLGQVRSEIERIESRLKFLSRQVDMSTISISLNSDDDIKVFGLKWRPLVVAKKALKNTLIGLTGYVDAMVSIVLFLPVIILWLGTFIIVLVIIWRTGRWVKKRFFN